jgi:hypothetical protein
METGKIQVISRKLVCIYFFIIDPIPLLLPAGNVDNCAANDQPSSIKKENHTVFNKTVSILRMLITRICLRGVFGQVRIRTVATKRSDKGLTLYLIVTVNTAHARLHEFCNCMKALMGSRGNCYDNAQWMRVSGGY